jgi:hypothetical protein
MTGTSVLQRRVGGTIMSHDSIVSSNNKQNVSLSTIPFRHRPQSTGRNIVFVLIILAFVMCFIVGSYINFYQVIKKTTIKLQTNTVTAAGHKTLQPDRKMASKPFKNEQTTNMKLSKRIATEVLKVISATRKEFHTRYGTEYSKRLLRDGVKRYGSIQGTAQRIINLVATTHQTDEANASSQKGLRSNFVLSFAGYSVTVGRGNFFNQSYPFVLQRILEPLFDSLLFDVVDDNNNKVHIGFNAVVRNSAIGGIPSFPYGFCFDHFLGRDSNVISWDYSMNEKSRDASVLEAYIRQSQNQFYDYRAHGILTSSQLPPMIIVLDMNDQRCSLLEHYTTAGLLPDAMCIGMAKDIFKSPKGEVFAVPDKERPKGFQSWDAFGAPDKCPGRSQWHPKKMEHEMIGWMIAMYFVDVVEYIVQQKSFTQGAFSNPVIRSDRAVEFPPTRTIPSKENPQSVISLLYGHPVTAAKYVMHEISCRTNFLPATDHENDLSSIIVSGLNSDQTAENIIEPRSDTSYKNGWVLDVSAVERTTKVKVEKCGGLGYIDMKIALYGLPESGPLRLWLPSESMVHTIDHHEEHHGGQENTDNASHWFDNLIICEANEKREKTACQLDTDVQYIVGGVTLSQNEPIMISGAGEYLKRKTCVSLGIPNNAKITRLKDVTLVDSTQVIPFAAKLRLARNRKRIFHRNGTLEDDQVGLIVDIVVRSRTVSREKGACCISHVVWEQR